MLRTSNFSHVGQIATTNLRIIATFQGKNIKTKNFNKYFEKTEIIFLSGEFQTGLNFLTTSSLVLNC